MGYFLLFDETCLSSEIQGTGKNLSHLDVSPENLLGRGMRVLVGAAEHARNAWETMLVSWFNLASSLAKW